MAQEKTQSPAALTADAARRKVSEFLQMMAVGKEPSSQIRTSRSPGEEGRIILEGAGKGATLGSGYLALPFLIHE